MSVHINDLPFELLDTILDFLPFRQQFMVERVCKKWQESIRKLLDQKKTLKLNYLYSKEIQFSVDDSNIDIFKNILLKCPNIKELDFHDGFVSGNNNLLAIAKLCPNLERIHFDKICVSKNEMEKLAKIIGPQLITFECLHINNIFVFILLKHLKNIEEITLEADKILPTKTIFHHLNSKCNNLNVLDWKPYDYENVNYQDENFINVMKRIQHLKIRALIISRFNFKMDNLTELTLYRCFNDDDMRKQKIFTNLKKLNIHHFVENDFEIISEFKFPKLESVSIKGFDFQNMIIPISFISQIEHIKSFEYFVSNGLLSSIPSIILQLNQLTELKQFDWDLIILFDDNLSYLFQCFDILSQHESLQNIRVKIDDANMKFKQFDKLINFCKAKPNTRIVIKIPKYKCVFDKNYRKFAKHYKKLFEEKKHFHKLNMELE